MRVGIEKREVYVGEGFTYQIQVQGSDQPKKPDMTGVEGFTVVFGGGSKNNSESVTIVNGRMTRRVRRAYIFSYKMTPTKAGNLVIPRVPVEVEGQVYRTPAVRVKVRKPAETEDFKLRLQLSRERCYVGQPITLTVTLYFAKNIRGVEFSLPVLDDARFGSADVKQEIGPRQGRQYVRIPLGQGEVIGKQGEGTLDGKEYATLAFRKVLLPRQAGRVKLPQATVACSVVMGYQRRRSRSIFDDDFFGGGQRRVVRKFIVPSNSPALDVLELPTAGRPAGFNGLVGTYRIRTSATPTEVNVGDPITLTIEVSGPDYLANVDLPSLGGQPDLGRDFKIPKDRAPAKAKDGVKVFTQTLRAGHAQVEAIPPIRLPYFDAETGKYEVARSEPIPLVVKPTKVVTVKDAEGASDSPGVRSRIEAWRHGIAHNYEDLGVLVDQRAGLAAWVRSPTWIGLICAPPAAYLALLIVTVAVRRRRADPAARQAKTALGALRRSLKRDGVDHAAVLEALKAYLGKKLRTSAGALTFADARDSLAAQGVAAEALSSLKVLFEACEAHRYAGGLSDGQDIADMTSRALAVAGEIERSLK